MIWLNDGQAAGMELLLAPSSSSFNVREREKEREGKRYKKIEICFGVTSQQQFLA